MNAVNSFIRRYWHLIVFVIGLCLFFWALYHLVGVLLPFLIGIILAYLIIP